MYKKLLYYVHKCVYWLQSGPRLLEKFFRWYGFVLYRYKWIFFIVPVIFTALSCTGFYFMDEMTRNDTEYVLCPFGSQSEYEKAVIIEDFPLEQNYYIPGKFFQVKNFVDVVVKAKDKGNLLRPEYIEALNEFNNFLMYNFTVQSYDGKFNLTYQKLCLSWDDQCFDNVHVKLMKEFKTLDKYNIPVTYPITRQGDVPVYLASVYGGVEMIDDVGRFNVVTSIRLSYHLKQEPSEIYMYAVQFRYAIQDYIVNLKSPLLDAGVYHADSVNQGLREVADAFKPQYVIMCMILCTFSIVCNYSLMRDGSRTIDWVRSKPCLGVFGVISAGMAIVTAMGLCLLFQQEYNVMVNTMGFLALSIGINDMFIMTNGWHRTKFTDTVDVRLSEMMSEAAVAVSITSFTDVFSFIIGTWNNLRGVIMFCEYIAFALFFDYVYQLTFFSAAIAIYGDLEHQGRHHVFYVKLKQIKDYSKATFWQKYLFNGTVIEDSNHHHHHAGVVEKLDLEKYANDNVGTEAKTDCHNRHKRNSNIDNSVVKHRADDGFVMPDPMLNKFFKKYFGPILMRPFTKFIVVVFFGIYLAIGFYGCSLIKEGIQPDRLVLRSHYVVHYAALIDDFWAEGMQAHIVVNNPPNITDGIEREKLLNMVSRFENTTYTLSSNATLFYLKEYMNYLRDLNVKIANTTDLWEDQFRAWLDYTGGRSLWITDIKWGNPASGEDPRNMTCFRFQVGLKHFESPQRHMETMDLLRDIADQFPEYNITTYHEYWPYADQYEMIKPTMLRDNIMAIGVMLLIAFFLIPHVLCGIFITVAMCTINIGIYGFMSLWGVNLDAVSMICCIMAIGFAIDLSAHICYAYILARGTSMERTVSALEQLGWPVFQGAAATILGVLVLATIDCYMVQTFFKTVFLVIFFGLLHSIVFLPVGLAILLPENRMRCLDHRHKSTVAPVLPAKLEPQEIKPT